MFDLRARKNGNPLVVGHRGAMAVAPGNTLPGLELGLARGADILELDVQLSADRQVMLFHDITLEAIAGVAGRVADYPASYLETLDVGAWFDPAFAGTTMPRLDTVLSWARGRVPLMIELKHEPAGDSDLEQLTVDLILDHGMADEVVFISFDQFALQRAKSRYPGIAASFIYVARLLNPLAQVSGLNVDALSPATNFLTPGEVRQIHAAGYACTPGGWWWDYPLLKSWGVDTVSANDPALVTFNA